ncbi:hypothetical protein GIB23_19645 [Pseudomonas putida]|uniref:phage head spike fiber domain-containing protein n=1 Tax=Pseudomonas putida TaxID=303 RepID=UPI001A8C1C3D|nr:hypothetical protein [Pseudomonas putida]MBO0369294.1 hypothetical protein [Pseudomonas putida]
MQAKSFSDLVTFSRSTVARYFNSAGLMVQAAVNEPRFEYNPATLAPLGLKMEPARTNSLTYSQDFSNSAWTKTRCTVALSGNAPDGTATAYKMTVTDAGSAAYLFRPNTAWAAATAYSFSLFAKADSQNIVSLQLPGSAFGVNTQVNFQLTGDGSFVVASGTPNASIMKLPDGWYKCSVMATSTAAVAAANWIAFSQPTGLGNSIFIWGAQLEVGIWHSSYIPTTTAAATRNADVAYLGVLSPWFNATEGTLYSEVVSNAGQAFHASLGTTASAGPRISNWKSATLPSSQVVDDSGATVYGQNFASVSPGQVIKQAIAFKMNDFQSAANGVTGMVDTAGGIPTPLRLTIGARGTTTDTISGHIRKIKFFPYRLSAAELQAVTT